MGVILWLIDPRGARKGGNLRPQEMDPPALRGRPYYWSSRLGFDTPFTVAGGIASGFSPYLGTPPRGVRRRRATASVSVHSPIVNLCKGIPSSGPSIPRG
jgi:hypothetical protein